jgi:trk system potassium uptake protein TrkA
MPSNQTVVIIGCGRLGSILANRLSREGNNVVLIDRDRNAFDKLTNDFSGFQIVGDAVELAVLRQAHIQEADCVLVTTRQENVNLMVAQVAQSVFSVPQVIARVYDPAREQIYEQFGVDTICPTRLAADAFVQELGAAI